MHDFVLQPIFTRELDVKLLLIHQNLNYDIIMALVKWHLAKTVTKYIVAKAIEKFTTINIFLLL